MTRTPESEYASSLMRASKLKLFKAIVMRLQEQVT
jgi:hypothetical protein